MKTSIDILALLNDEDLYEYIDNMNQYMYTKKELTDLIYKRGIETYINSSCTKENIINILLDSLANKIITKALKIEREMKFWELEKILMELEKNERLSFVRKYGKYFSEYNLKSLIRQDCEIKLKSYEEMLLDLYIQELTKKKNKK